MDKGKLVKILLSHFEKYPIMKPTDAVKLLYQNEYGGGHIITDTDACMKRLKNEYNTLTYRSGLRYDDIGNSLVRLELDSVAPDKLDMLGFAFIESAKAVHGKPDSFMDKLAILTEIVKNGDAPFSYNEFDKYLTEYSSAGYPMVSHSDEYRKQYKPAYRVILLDYVMNGNLG